jgi:HAE1 family hydrophobic/amphiphilic exporter-1
MYLLGYSLDNMSLMALTLSVGFVVTTRSSCWKTSSATWNWQAADGGGIHRRAGDRIHDSSMTVSLAAVFIPVPMSGILGRLLHEFAVTIGVAILVSGFVSLSLTPMLCSRFLRPPHEQKHNRFYKASERFFDGMLNVYDRTLRAVLRHRKATMLVSALILVATGFLFARIPMGFIPPEDTRQVFGFTEAAQDASFQSMIKHQQQIADIVKQDPNVDSFMSSVGAVRMGPAMGRVHSSEALRAKAERGRSHSEFRPKLATVPGMNVYLQNPRQFASADSSARASASSRCRERTSRSSTRRRRSSKDECGSCRISRT